MGLFTLLIFLANFLIFSSCEKGPIVKIPLGSILGTVQTSRNGFNYFSFRSVRYAKAAQGGLQFKPPVPVGPWKGILNATQDDMKCHPFHRNKDCSFLNVYTRRINQKHGNRPVLVFIDDTKFEYNTAVSSILGPDYLMDHDIVLVTISFRTGFAGYFSTGDKHAPGNYGLKDQVEALKWVKRYIKFFGGNPNQVTISGKEAGAASVGLHMVSPMSRGLFHGAMILSGSPINSWVINKNPRESAKNVLGDMGCPTEISKNSMYCLRYKKTDGESDNHIHHQRRRHEYDYYYGHFTPVIESEDSGEERFLVQDPITSILEGDVARVPVFIGTTKYEQADEIFELTYEETHDELSQNWTDVIPKMCNYEPDDEKSNKLREFYLGDVDSPITNKSIPKLLNLFSDARIIYGVIEFTKLIAEKNGMPVYLYQYNHFGKSIWSFLKEKYIDPNIPDEIFYMLDNFYIFDHGEYFNKISSNTKDGRFVTKMTTLWKNFIESGNPTPERSAVLDNVKWEPYTNENPTYLNINDTFKLKHGLYYEERMSLWEDLFPIEGMHDRIAVKPMLEMENALTKNFYDDK